MPYDPDWGEPDRESEDDRGRPLYGYDDPERESTTWVYGDGTVDCETDG